MYNNFYKIPTSDYLIYTSFYLNNHYYYYYYYYYFLPHLNTHDSYFLKSLPLSHPKPPPPPTHTEDSRDNSSFGGISSFGDINNSSRRCRFFFFSYPKSKPQIQPKQTQVYKKDNNVSNLTQPHSHQHHTAAKQAPVVATHYQ